MKDEIIQFNFGYFDRPSSFDKVEKFQWIHWTIRISIVVSLNYEVSLNYVLYCIRLHWNFIRKPSFVVLFGEVKNNHWIKYLFFFDLFAIYLIFCIQFDFIKLKPINKSKDRINQMNLTLIILIQFNKVDLKRKI